MTVIWLRRGAASTCLSMLLVAVCASAGCGGDSPDQPAPSVAGAKRQSPPAEPTHSRDELKAGHAVRFPGRLLVRLVDERAPGSDGRLLELISFVGVRQIGGIACDRFHISPTGAGLCLQRSPTGSASDVIVVDRRLRPVAHRRVDGVPSRARVTRDGRYGAYTVLVDGNGYTAHTRSFSTVTRIVDMRHGDTSMRLEDLDVRRGGRSVSLDGAELWSVTFGSGDRFYATLALASGTSRLMIAGRLGDDRAHVVADGARDPSVSPDGRRIAYWRTAGAGPGGWRLHVRDLRDGRDVALAETLSLDDQPEWLGNRLVAYSNGREVYAVRADGSGKPSRLARSSASPTWLPASSAAAP